MDVSDGYYRFETEFLQKRQQKLQIYVNDLIRTPDIFKEMLLLEFFEMHHNIDLNSDIQFYAAGEDPPVLNLTPNRNSAVCDSNVCINAEHERLNAIIEQANNEFIDISQNLEGAENKEKEKQILTRCEECNAAEEFTPCAEPAMTVHKPSKTQMKVLEKVLEKVEEEKFYDLIDGGIDSNESVVVSLDEIHLNKDGTEVEPSARASEMVEA